MADASQRPPLGDVGGAVAAGDADLGTGAVVVAAAGQQHTRQL